MTLAGVGTRFVPTDIGAFRYTFRTLVDVYARGSFSSKAIETGTLYTDWRILAHVFAFTCTLIATFHLFDRQLIFSHAFRTTSEPSAVTAKKPIRRRIHEHVAIRALVNRNEVSIVRRQYVLPSGVLGKVSVFDRRSLNKFLSQSLRETADIQLRHHSFI